MLACSDYFTVFEDNAIFSIFSENLQGNVCYTNEMWGTTNVDFIALTDVWLYTKTYENIVVSCI